MKIITRNKNSDCKALYCEKCALALVDLENACWACNDQIDDSKPVKFFEKKEKDIDVEIPRKKK